VNRQLRLALGMRGGVSLAVWIGGAAVEIDHLCRSGNGFWAEVLRHSPYDDVIVDVIAGASAGALNGVLLAASQQYGFRLDGVRELWLDVGGLDDLVRRSSSASSPSLLDGDGAFLDVVRAKLGELISRPDTRVPDHPPRIDLQLSATLVEPIVRRARSPIDEQLDERRSAARFHFRNEPALGASDFAAVADPDGHDAALWRLALAARATSSYPVAFEAALVRSTRAPSYAADAADGTGRLVDMRGIFTDRATPSQDLVSTAAAPSDFVVADGGILDNIPLGKAITAIQQAAADGPTARMLMYLQPGAPARARGADAGRAHALSADRRRSTAGVLRGVFKAFYESESIAGDIAALEAHNERVAMGRVLRQGTFATLGDRAALLAAAARGLPSYRQHRAVDDADLISRLLDDPIAALGEDLLAVRGALDDSRYRSPLAYWAEDRREDLGVGLIKAFEGRIDVAGLTGSESSLTEEQVEAIFAAGVRPLARVTQLLIEWARHLEEGWPSAGVVKARLYRVASFIDAALERPRRAAWLALAIDAGVDVQDEPATTWLPAWIKATSKRIGGLLKMTPADADRMAAALGPDGGDDHGELDEFIAAVAARLDGARAPGHGAVDVRMVLAEQVLVPYAECLRNLRTAPAAATGTSPGSVAGVEGALLDAVLADGPVDLTTLGALEVVCFPEFVAGAPGQRRIDFVRLSAGNRTPVAGWFAALVRAAEDQHLSWTPPVTAPAPVVDGPQGIPVEVKLAGNELANFAAFLRPSWRANDWMWGRLDAVPTLVDLLLTPTTVRASLGSMAPAEALAAAKSLVVGNDVSDPSDGWRTWLEANVWTRYRDAIERELGSLGSSGATVDAIRDAVVCRRQWEIIAEELALSTEHGIADRPPLVPDDAVAAVATYAVGAESITAPKTRDTADAFRSLSESAARTLEWHLAPPPVDAPATRRPGISERAVRTLARAVRLGGSVASSAVLGPSPARRLLRTAWAPVFAVVVVVGLFVWAVLEDWLAVVLTLAGIVLTVLAVVLVFRRSRGSPSGA
jgi:patatin-related protein